MDNTLTGRCVVAYEEALNTISVNSIRRRDGIRAVIEHLAAELTILGHADAARSLLAQLNAQVIPLRPTTQEPA
jgi:hypothetical protein